MSSNPSNEGLKVIDKRPQFDESPNLPVAASPNAVVMMAMQKNYTPELIEKMMALQERYEANEARKAYHEAMSAFKANPPEIGKDKNVSYTVQGKGTTSYAHASLANVTGKINRALSEHGLSAGWTTIQNDKGITVTCTITHKFGHSESTSLTAAPDTSGSKNAIQAIGSTVSYLERYTILALTGLATHDMDDDGKGGNGSGDGKMTLFEKWEIKCDEAMKAAKTVEDMIQFWPDNSAAVKKELSKADASKIYYMFTTRKKELEAAEREPGSDDK